MDSKQFREAAHAAIDEIIDYYDTLQDRNVVSDVEPGYLAKIVPENPPELGERWEDIQRDIAAKIIPGLTHWQSPKFMAYFPASVTYPSILGELYSAAFTGPAFSWICSPAVTELETIVSDWLAKALHLPHCYLSTTDGGGVIKGSASESVATIAAAAREQYLMRSTAHLEGEEREVSIARKRGKLVVLGSESSHSSVEKAALIVGTKYKTIPTGFEENFSITGENLQRTLDQCQQEGLEPYLLCATLGTTSTCAVDDFKQIADVMTGHSEIWIHIDAAYAGAALVCEEYQHLTEHLGAFDSFNVNMHKWLLTNFDASFLFVKRRKNLTDALSVTPSYLKNSHSESGQVIDYRDWEIALGRRFRALKVWFVMRTYGLQGLRAYIRRHIELGEYFHSLVASRSDLFQIFTKPAFALTVFYVAPQSRTSVPPPNCPSDSAREINELFDPTKVWPLTSVDLNTLTREVYESFNSKKEYFLTSTVVGGQYVIRVVSANPKAEKQYLTRAFEILVDTAEKVLEMHHQHEHSGANGKVVNGV